MRPHEAMRLPGHMESSQAMGSPQPMRSPGHVGSPQTMVPPQHMELPKPMELPEPRSLRSQWGRCRRCGRRSPWGRRIHWGCHSAWGPMGRRSLCVDVAAVLFFAALGWAQGARRTLERRAVVECGVARVWQAMGGGAVWRRMARGGKLGGARSTGGRVVGRGLLLSW